MTWLGFYELYAKNKERWREIDMVIAKVRSSVSVENVSNVTGLIFIFSLLCSVFCIVGYHIIY